MLVDATRLPDGTVLELVVDDEGDNLDARERRALDGVIARAWKSAKLGKLRSSPEILREIRNRK